jgi:hypothetical protein
MFCETREAGTEENHRYRRELVWERRRLILQNYVEQQAVNPQVFAVVIAGEAGAIADIHYC